MRPTGSVISRALRRDAGIITTGSRSRQGYRASDGRIFVDLDSDTERRAATEELVGTLTEAGWQFDALADEGIITVRAVPSGAETRLK